MATFADLIAAVQALLSASGARAALELNSATPERAFEAYVFALVLRAIRRAGGTVRLMGIQTGQNPNPLVFRGSPGQMSSRTQDFVYARCTLNGYEFELHVAGRSNGPGIERRYRTDNSFQTADDRRGGHNSSQQRPVSHVNHV